MNIASFAFVDTAMLGATLTLKYSKHFAETAPGVHTIVLRGPANGGDWSADAAQTDYELLESWPSAKQLLAATEGRLKEHLGGQNIQFGRLVIEELSPGQAIGWQIDTTPYGKAHARFRLLLLAAAGFCLYSGGESLGPGVGNLTFFNHQVMHSVVNLGPVSAVSLVADVRRPPVQ